MRCWPGRGQSNSGRWNGLLEGGSIRPFPGRFLTALIERDRQSYRGRRDEVGSSNSAVPWRRAGPDGGDRDSPRSAAEILSACALPGGSAILRTACGGQAGSERQRKAGAEAVDRAAPESVAGAAAARVAERT